MKRICASSWTVTKNHCMMHGQQNVKKNSAVLLFFNNILPFNTTLSQFFPLSHTIFSFFLHLGSRRDFFLNFFVIKLHIGPSHFEPNAIFKRQAQNEHDFTHKPFARATFRTPMSKPKANCTYCTAAAIWWCCCNTNFNLI